MVWWELAAKEFATDTKLTKAKDRADTVLGKKDATGAVYLLNGTDCFVPAVVADCD